MTEQFDNNQVEDLSLLPGLQQATDTDGATNVDTATMGPSPFLATIPENPEMLNNSSKVPQSSTDEVTGDNNPLYTPASYPHNTSPNPFTHRTAYETLGFLSPAATLALNHAAETVTRPTELPPTEHSAAFDESNRPLQPGENVFTIPQQRMHNILGGWVPSDASETPAPDVINQDMEPEKHPTRAVKPRRGQRGRRMRGNGRRQGFEVRNGTVDVEGDHGAFDDTEEFFEQEGKGLDPLAVEFTPVCRLGDGKVDRLK